MEDFAHFGFQSFSLLDGGLLFQGSSSNFRDTEVACGYLTAL